LRAMLAQYDVDPMPMRQPLAPLSVSKNTGIQKISSAKKDTSKTSILATPGKGASSASAATPAYSKWTQRLSSVTGATPVRAASTYGSSSSSTALSWSSIKARLPKKGDQIQCVLVAAMFYVVLKQIIFQVIQWLTDRHHRFRHGGAASVRQREPHFAARCADGRQTMR
jgi:hypothetical protein